MEHTYFPIFINMDKKKVFVFGGGFIAARRVAALLRFGAAVTLCAPEINDNLLTLKEEYPQMLRLCHEPYQPGFPQADFVFSAVNDKAVDEAIFLECKKRSIPVNIASDQSLCDFYFPALIEQEEMVIGISSGGKNHGLVKRAAQRIRELLGGEAWN